MKFYLKIKIGSPTTGVVVASGYGTREPMESTPEGAEQEFATLGAVIAQRQLMSLVLFPELEDGTIASEQYVPVGVLDTGVFHIELVTV